jgi:hypothetical protein
MSIVVVSLILAICGYAFLSFKKLSIKSRIFLLHFLLSIPMFIGLLYPSETLDMGSLREDEIVKLFAQRERMEYIFLSIFVVGQLTSWMFFIKHFRGKPITQQK